MLQPPSARLLASEGDEGGPPAPRSLPPPPLPRSLPVTSKRGAGGNAWSWSQEAEPEDRMREPVLRGRAEQIPGLCRVSKKPEVEVFAV